MATGEPWPVRSPAHRPAPSTTGRCAEMACDPLQPASCVASVAASGAEAATTAVASSFADTMRDGAVWVIKTTVAWWIDVPAIDLDTSPATAIRGYVLGIAAMVAVAGVIWQGILLALSRR